ncbi:MAG: FlgD immunoglobulin-like domain containing protein [bacterium]
MRVMKLCKAALFFVSASPLFAQITIDWTEVPQIIGTSWTININNAVTVDLGSQGGPQTWNFTSQPMGTDSAVLFVVPVLSTPFADSFPDANLIYKSGEDGDTAYQYYDLDPAFMCMLGLAVVTTDTSNIIRYIPADSVPLPVNYGDSNYYHYGYLVDFGMGPMYECRFDNHGKQFINAYGTVVIPYGSFECLCVCAFDTCDFSIDSGGVNIYFQRTTRIKYSFPTEDFGSVVCITSYPGETNPNFTEAEVIERLTFFSTGIEESETASIFSLSHQPNPFSSQVAITYSLSKTNHVDLKIYDINGRLVRTVVNTSQPQGNYSAMWYGKDELGNPLPDGVYFYHLNIDETSLTGKMLMLR